MRFRLIRFDSIAQSGLRFELFLYCTFNCTVVDACICPDVPTTMTLNAPLELTGVLF